MLRNRETVVSARTDYGEQAMKAQVKAKIEEMRAAMVAPVENIRPDDSREYKPVGIGIFILPAPARHRHDWHAQRAYSENPITVCGCGATRKFRNGKWIVRPKYG